MLAQSRLEMAQSDVHRRETIIELQGHPAICESLIHPRRIMVHEELQAIRFPESCVRQGKTGVLLNGGIQRRNG